MRTPKNAPLGRFFSAGGNAPERNTVPPETGFSYLRVARLPRSKPISFDFVQRKLHFVTGVNKKV
ncbi:MAG: hypothetical protein Q8R69_19980 [Telluria sp.]|nr:hypothetical protein [Telluria sp.]